MPQGLEWKRHLRLAVGSRKLGHNFSDPDWPEPNKGLFGAGKILFSQDCQTLPLLFIPGVKLELYEGLQIQLCGCLAVHPFPVW